MSQPCPPVLTLRHILSSVFCQPINFYWGPWLDMNRSGTLTPECMETAWTFLTFLWMYTTDPSLALHLFTLRFANREIQTLLRPQRNLSGDASEGRGFLPQGGGHLFENLLQAFSPTSKTHSRSRPSYSYQPPSYHQYHPPPSYAPPPQPEPIQEEPVQVVLKGQHALSDSFSPSVDYIFTKSWSIIWRWKSKCHTGIQIETTPAPNDENPAFKFANKTSMNLDGSGYALTLLLVGEQNFLYPKMCQDLKQVHFF